MQQSARMGFAAWQDAVSDSFVSLTTETHRRARFAASMDVSEHDPMTLTSIDAQPHTVRRTPELIGTDAAKNLTTNYYKVSLQTGGHGMLIQDGREVSLEPGTLAIYDTSRPYILSFDRAFSSHVMMFPHSRLTFPQEGIRQLTATVLGSGRQLGQLSSQMMAQAAKTLPELSRSMGNRLASNVIDLINTLVADELHDGAKATRRQQQLAEIRNYIDARLADPGLDVTEIAGAHHMSVRSLHYLFENEPESVTDLLRRRRMDNAQRDLADPLQHDIPVGRIGARWGLSDPAYFSRVFRDVVGMSPTEYRLRAVEDATAIPAAAWPQIRARMR